MSQMRCTWIGYQQEARRYYLIFFYAQYFSNRFVTKNFYDDKQKNLSAPASLNNRHKHEKSNEIACQIDW